ncbi:TonB-linked outer membrane protein, SusC/RagA family [Catalinimonas alkaloidigena]|uniref:TonB-linked outer membrane protein, SusC/RagA family n=1 Tax=Catalinimonas alkaloidigena TaxID=1075417 RepID=A0A1G8YG95_9BACT|nr:SusC/RagA family TonB-linked outer membrane protein [Catalinimonas alkaloidigena]SDK01848.1 TonB-linked outer membrane protein, SusC/RagA family [Catalinimonas alkaloidigena]
MKHTLFFLLLFLLALPPTVARAQTTPTGGRTVSGTVLSADDNLPVPGVNVLVKGSTAGTITDIDGHYQLPVPSDEATLIFSFIGFISQEVPVGSQSTLDVTMQTDTRQLDEIVVTALGIEREKKALGYAVQEIQGKSLTQARETNVVNSLSGKFAGVQITSSNGAPGSSSRIVIRGASSVGSNNQPLFVVDGIPINNENYGSSTSVDYGNGASSLNPDDIASVSVLKGPSAAALYGSRAANGVILITTKSGKGTQGIGVSVNSTATFEEPFRLPNFQNQYGQGGNLQFAFVDGKGGGVNDGVDESWGPPLDGRLIPQFNSPIDPTTGERIPTPWVAHPDNVKDFYRTGTTFTNNVALTGGNDKANFRLSFTNLAQQGILPNTDYKRNTIALSGGVQLTPKLSAKASVNYVKDGSDNRQNFGLYFIWFGRQVDIHELKEYSPRSDDQVQYNWNYNYWNNPYYALTESTRANQKDRLFGNVMVTYEFTDWLNLFVRTGTDFFGDRRQNRIARMNKSRFSSYSEDVYVAQETNSDFLFSITPKLGGDFEVSANLGGNNRMNEYRRDYMYAAQLAIPGVYNIGNSLLRPEVANSYTKKVVNSLYGSAQLAYRNAIFLELTGRNDWSSTLPAANRSYFYPSASLSAVVTDLIPMSTRVLSFAKVRASIAQVGNDTDPYRLQQILSYEDPWNTNSSVSVSNTINNADLKPEITTGTEVGADIRFFNNRIGLDVTYYNQISRNQILNVNVSQASGFNDKILNAGEIQNKGVEVQLNLTPVKLENSFQWDIGVNFARNRNQVVSLADGLTTYQLGSIRGMSIEARVGQPYGTFFGTPYLRDPDGNIVHVDGIPQLASERAILGNFTPDWLGGFANTFTYKGLTLYTLIDVRHGGDLFSQTVNIGRYTGVLAETVEGRETGIVGEGTMNTGTDENPQYVPNDVRVDGQRYYQTLYGLYNNEANIFDGSFVKLREVRLGYQIPDRVFGKLPFRNVTLSAVGRNLLLLHSNVPHIDPESSYYSSDSNVQGIESGQILSTRSVGFNLNFSL